MPGVLTICQSIKPVLSIRNSISRHCFRLTRDWKLERFANGKEVPNEKGEYL